MPALRASIRCRAIPAEWTLVALLGVTLDPAGDRTALTRSANQPLAFKITD